MSLKDNFQNAFRASAVGKVISVTDLLVQEMSDQEGQRLKKIADAWDAYAGKLEAPLKATRSDPQGKDNILLGLTAPLVDTGVSFLVGKGVQFQVDGETEGTANDWLKDCLTANKFDTKLQLLALNGGVCGDVFVRLREPQPGLCKGFPRIINLDPACVEVVWAPDDFEHVLQYKLQWNGVDPVSKRVMAYRQLISEDPGGKSWTLQDQVSEENSNVWTNTGAEETWAYPFAPILHCQNLPAPNSYYGQSDLEEDVVSVNRGINFVFSNMARIIRIHAHPKTWGRGIVAKELSIGVDETILLASKDAELKNLEMASDLTSSLALIDHLKDALHEIARVPQIATGNFENIGQLSGLAMQILYQSIVDKTNLKRRFYGDLLSDLCTQLLVIGKQGDHDITPQWPAVLPSDPAQETAGLEADQRMGIVSKDTLASKRGYDYQDEKNKIADEQQDLGDNLLTGFDRGQGAASGASGLNVGSGAGSNGSAGSNVGSGKAK